MLVLSRKRNETIVIGDNVKITVLELKANCVRLGIEAPPDKTVHRLEIYLAIQKERGNSQGSV